MIGFPPFQWSCHCICLYCLVYMNDLFKRSYVRTPFVREASQSRILVNSCVLPFYVGLEPPLHLNGSSVISVGFVCCICAVCSDFVCLRPLQISWPLPLFYRANASILKHCHLLGSPLCYRVRHCATGLPLCYRVRHCFYPVNDRGSNVA